MRAAANGVRLVALLAIVALACQAPAPPPRQGAAAAPAAQAPAAPSDGPTRVTIGVTETIESQNPYADSVALGYAVWCEVLGCLVAL